jgi:hypothetical protein
VVFHDDDNDMGRLGDTGQWLDRGGGNYGGCEEEACDARRRSGKSACHPGDTHLTLLKNDPTDICGQWSRPIASTPNVNIYYNNRAECMVAGNR